MRRLFMGGAWALGGALVVFAVTWWAFPFPEHLLEPAPCGGRVIDRHGVLLAERVAPDEAFRVAWDPARVDARLLEATIAVEDHRFRSHLGVDPWAVLRAACQNVTSGRVVSGASTLTMQVCRMLEPRPRTWRSKLIEAFRALQLERLRTKDEILSLYVRLAPYGGNRVGAEAGSRAWFGHGADHLTWAEAALLAGLPQSPTRFDPWRHLDAACRRQRAVLQSMAETGVLDAEEAQRWANVDVRRRPTGAVLAPHLVAEAFQRRPTGGALVLDGALQADVEEWVARFAQGLSTSSDVAVVVIDIATGELRASVGSASWHDALDGQVDGTRALRSPGSTLKPFVYALAFQSRRLGPESPVWDVPVRRGAWSPRNFDREYLGEMTAADALRRSRNVPAVLVAEACGVERGVELLRALGLEVQGDAARTRGLAWVTGAVEVRLRSLTNAYAALARGGVWSPVRVFAEEPPGEARRVLAADACEAVTWALSTRQRTPPGLEHVPVQERPWFMSKTGTSSHRRDAWAVGHNGRWAVGVWVGRFSGAGDDSYVGRTAAEPLLVSLFQHRRLRVDAAPPPPPTWTVVRPIAPPKEVLHSWGIIAPMARARPVAQDGTASVRCRVQGGVEPIVWFLDGLEVGRGLDVTCVVTPGRHMLRCIDAEGRCDEQALDVVR